MARIALVTLFCLVCLSTGVLGSLFEGGEDGGLFEQFSDKPILKMMFLKNVLGGAVGGGSGPPPVLKALLLKKIFSESAGEEDESSPLLRALSGDTPSPILRALIAKQIMQNGDQAILPKLLLLKTIVTNVREKIVADIKEAIEDKRIYSFAVPLVADSALEYTNDEGEMKGFQIDLLKKVCEVAGKKCVGIYDSTENCVGHDGRHFTVGKGLAGKEYDACFGWFKSVARSQAVNFTESYWEIENKYNFYVKEGNPNGFDPTNIGSKRIGFVTAWAGGDPCLSGIDGYDTASSNYAQNLIALLDNLKNDEDDAIFLQQAYSQPALDKGYIRIGDVIECSDSEVVHGVYRKDNPLTWFSDTLRAMKEDGTYYGVCAKAANDHAEKGGVSCV
ncbi:uncharacterized protein LOC100372126 [Saccoglossus kowalevskii]|uniref:Uncharacterized protein LOC100372126 n=1 Tax=Saccoglossus kowalevskii TaxID=10224 RepID=A0ABM0GSJ1_SACKO|nr:PREDICTED: uncharacterized protein LOC100372126 [Saccoglossus kowalevskii]